MKFRYKEVALVCLTIIRVAIKNPRIRKTHRCHALIDSGADMNLFSSDIAEAIGLDLESVEKPERDYSRESQATYTIPVIFVGGRVGVPCRHVFHETLSGMDTVARTKTIYSLDTLTIPSKRS